MSGVAQAHGASTIGLWVNKANRAAISLYDKAGFHRTGEADKLPSDPTQQEIRMLRCTRAQGGSRDLAQLREQAAQLPGQGLRRFGDDHEHRVAAGVGDPGLLGGRAGELQRVPYLLHLPGAELGPGVPVGIEEPERGLAGRRHGGGPAP